MKSSIRDVGDIRIIELSGKITIGAGDVKIRELIGEAIEDGKQDVILDLGGVTAIDSSGIGEMVACYTTVTKRGGQLKLMQGVRAHVISPHRGARPPLRRSTHRRAPR